MKTPADHKYTWLHKPLMLGAILLLIASLTPYAPASNRLTDLLSHFPVYYLAAAIAGLALAIYAKAPRKTTRFIAVAMALNVLTLWPYLPFASNDPATAKTIKILQTNTLFINTQTEALADLITREKPDIIALSEVNSVAAASLDQFADEYPHRLVKAADNHAYGLALLSRLPAADLTQEHIGYKNTPSFTATLDIDGHKIHLASIHPRTPLDHLTERDAVFTALADKYKAVREKDENLIILGDFNATPWCPAMKTLTKALNLNHARAGHGLTPTWPQWLPAPMRLPIDHVLIGGKIKTAQFYLGPHIGSDHLPTMTLITLP